MLLDCWYNVICIFIPLLPCHPHHDGLCPFKLCAKISPFFLKLLCQVLYITMRKVTNANMKKNVIWLKCLNCEFPGAVLISYHKLDDFDQQKFVVSFTRVKVWNQHVCRGMLPLETQQGTYPYPLSTWCLLPCWSCGPTMSVSASAVGNFLIFSPMCVCLKFLVRMHALLVRDYLHPEI